MTSAKCAAKVRAVVRGDGEDEGGRDWVVPATAVTASLTPWWPVWPRVRLRRLGAGQNTPSALTLSAPPPQSAREALVAKSRRRAVLVDGHPRQRPLETDAALSTMVSRSCGPEASVGPGSGRDLVGVETSFE